MIYKKVTSRNKRIIKNVRKLFPEDEYQLIDAHYHLSKKYESIKEPEEKINYAEEAGYDGIISLIHYIDHKKMCSLSDIIDMQPTLDELHERIHKKLKSFKNIIPGVEINKFNKEYGITYHKIEYKDSGKNKHSWYTHPFKNNGIVYDIYCRKNGKKKKATVVPKNKKRKIIKKIKPDMINLTNPTFENIQLSLDERIRMMSGTDFHPVWTKNLGLCGTIIKTNEEQFNEKIFLKGLKEGFENFWEEDKKVYYTLNNKIHYIK